jgi:hypothetical protein
VHIGFVAPLLGKQFHLSPRTVDGVLHNATGKALVKLKVVYYQELYLKHIIYPVIQLLTTYSPLRRSRHGFTQFTEKSSNNFIFWARNHSNFGQEITPTATAQQQNIGLYGTQTGDHVTHLVDKSHPRSD